MKNLQKIKREKRIQRHKRVRAKIFGTEERPRLCVFRSNKHIYAQLIDDEMGKTLLTVHDMELKRKKSSSSAKTTKEKTRGKEEKQYTLQEKLAYEVGKLIAQRASDKKIEKVVFDRDGYRYHGRVKALAEGVREGGLKF